MVEESVVKIVQALDDLIDQCNSQFENGATLRTRHGQHYPDLGADFLVSKANKLKKYLHSREFESTDEFEELCQSISQNFSNWASVDRPRLTNSTNVLYPIFTFESYLTEAYDQLALFEIKDRSEDLQLEQIQLRKRLENVDDRLKELEEQTENLEETVANINSAKKTADHLPETLKSLKEALGVAQVGKTETEKLLVEIDAAHKRAREADAFIGNKKSEIDTVLQKSEQALATATSTGLAASFNKHYDKLGTESIWWVVVLAVSLGLAALFGFLRLEDIFVLLTKSNTPMSVIILNLLLSSVIIGAPIWLAWVATKRVGYLFRLREDYGFKASISTAYEGFRREAANQSDDMEQRVLESTLKRFDEAPLRLVDERVYGSPVHEVLKSKEFLEALKTIPDFGKHIATQAREALAQRNRSKETKDEVIDKSE